MTNQRLRKFISYRILSVSGASRLEVTERFVDKISDDVDKKLLKKVGVILSPLREEHTKPNFENLLNNKS